MLQPRPARAKREPPAVQPTATIVMKQPKRGVPANVAEVLRAVCWLHLSATSPDENTFVTEHPWHGSSDAINVIIDYLTEVR